MSTHPVDKDRYPFDLGLANGQHDAGRSVGDPETMPGQPPARRIFGAVNAAAGLLTGRVAPGEVISIFGPHIRPPLAVTATPAGGFVPTTLVGVQVFIDGTPAPLLYASDTQINAIVPFETEGKPAASMRLVLNGTVSPDFPLAVVAAVPEIFRNADGQSAAALNEDGSLNSPDHPAQPGSIVAIWTKGAGFAALHDGEITAGANNSYCCRVQVDSSAAEVLYAGSAPALAAGIVQINFRLPAQVFTPTITVIANFRASSPAGIYVSQ